MATYKQLFGMEKCSCGEMADFIKSDNGKITAWLCEEHYKEYIEQREKNEMEKKKNFVFNLQLIELTNKYWLAQMAGDQASAADQKICCFFLGKKDIHQVTEIIYTKGYF